MKKPQKRTMTRRVRKEAPADCSFCKENKKPHFASPQTLSRFLTERGKIVGRSRSGLCSKHQKQLTLAIKHARHLALLPFVVRV